MFDMEYSAAWPLYELLVSHDQCDRHPPLYTEFDSKSWDSQVRSPYSSEGAAIFVSIRNLELPIETWRKTSNFGTCLA